VPDGDVPELARAVRALLDDDARWAELSARGLERAREFSWQKSVTEHAELLQRLSVS
jgi:glycosyltransferase involved in cell wall biosynthesis